MTKVEFRKTLPNGSGKTPRVTERHTKDRFGAEVTLQVVDIDSESFGEDLRYVFARNVAEARRENQRLTGAPDADIVVGV